ncbi:MAG: DUF4118 domain-containing protein [Moraxellaceae bacterium]
MNDTQRPDPDQLLARVRKAETEKQRGRLKIFFGASPGVGKTFSMLAAASALQREGVDVVAGYVEPHERPETRAQLASLPTLPVREITHRDRLLKEFDLDAALSRRAAITLVDELAHSNAPGSRHAKRWQDVEELLGAGLDVWSTLNVQHLESLNDVVARITGVQVRETLPDHVFENANDVELIDLPPEELLTRLQAGRIYLPEQARKATQSFFRKGNLIALRELALRAMAERVDADVRDWRGLHAQPGVWPVRERVLVALGPHSDADVLVRTGKRLAVSLQAPWEVVYVETPRLQRLPDTEREKLLRVLALAESLGARTITLSGHDIASTLLAHARSANITRIVLGRPRQKWRWPGQGSLLDTLSAQAPDLELFVAAAHKGESPSRHAASLSRGLEFLEITPRRHRRYVWATLATLSITALVWPVSTLLAPVNLAMFYLAGIVLVSWRLGSGPSALSAFLSVALFDFFYVQPRLTFAVADTEYIITFIVMLGTGLLLSRLTGQLQAQARIALQRERRAQELYALSQELAIGLEVNYIAEVAVRHLATLFDAEAVLLLPAPDEKIRWPEGDALPASLRRADLGVAQWVYDNEQPAGLGTQTLPGSTAHYLPLKASLRTRGVLALQTRDKRRLFAPEQHRLLETFATQIAIALERVHFADVAQSTELRMREESLRNSLLAAISHDVRTPLAGIVGSASSLLTHQHAPEKARELLSGIHDEAMAMSTLAGNLLDMARLQTGPVQLRREWQPIEEIVGSALRGTARSLAAHSVDVILAPDLPLVEIDSVLMERVLVNLLENAAKYTAAGTGIQLRANVQENTLRLEVEDAGPGLPEDSEKLFAKFVRGEKESSTTGVGLGLALCRAIVEAHGGHITARQGHQGGALFCITLPLGKPPAPPPPDLAGESHE